MKYALLLLCTLPLAGHAQPNDSSLVNYPVWQAPVYRYEKPKAFSFLTNIPRDVAGCTKFSFSKKQLPPLLAMAGSTALLFLADQSITNSLQDISEDHSIASQESFSPIFKMNIAGKSTNIGKLPRNINTFFYDLGQGSTAMWLAAGFFTIGKIKHDNRSLQTASELTEAFIALGVGTQFLKYVTGRENPSDATATRGAWHPFPSFSDFQNHKTKYDAFPSGHMATFVSAVTIIAQNYPEKKWIAPLGYSISGLCALSMINNGVHWASDFPLGFALGYAYGKFISKKRRILVTE